MKFSQQFPPLPWEGSVKKKISIRHQAGRFEGNLLDALPQSLLSVLWKLIKLVVNSEETSTPHFPDVSFRGTLSGGGGGGWGIKHEGRKTLIKPFLHLHWPRLSVPEVNNVDKLNVNLQHVMKACTFYEVLLRSQNHNWFVNSFHCTSDFCPIKYKKHFQYKCRSNFNYNGYGHFAMSTSC